MITDTHWQGNYARPEGQPTAPLWRRYFRAAGPGLLISVGYMDPGNWATDLGAGASFGMSLLWVVLLSSVSAILLQTMSLRLGIVSGVDLARACRDRYSPAISRLLWIMAEVAIVACDVAEVLGAALAINLLFRLPLLWGIALTGLDTVLLLALQGRGYRRVEAIVLALVATISVCFGLELALANPDWNSVLTGFAPQISVFHQPRALFFAVGILGATIMPHNLYLHSSLVLERSGPTERERRSLIKLSVVDTSSTLLFAFFINAAILVLAATVFHATAHADVDSISHAYNLLEPVVGLSLAPLLFGIALLASGQSSTLTGTMAGQVILNGFLKIQLAPWKRRLITRALALIPAFFGVWRLGSAGLDSLLIGSQIVLSLQLPFAIWPLIRLTSSDDVMGSFKNGWPLRWTAWGLLAIIIVANLFLCFAFLDGLS